MALADIEEVAVDPGDGAGRSPSRRRLPAAPPRPDTTVQSRARVSTNRPPGRRRPGRGQWSRGDRYITPGATPPSADAVGAGRSVSKAAAATAAQRRASCTDLITREADHVSVNAGAPEDGQPRQTLLTPAINASTSTRSLSAPKGTTRAVTSTNRSTSSRLASTRACPSGDWSSTTIRSSSNSPSGRTRTSPSPAGSRRPSARRSRAKHQAIARRAGRGKRASRRRGPQGGTTTGRARARASNRGSRTDAAPRRRCPRRSPPQCSAPNRRYGTPAVTPATAAPTRRIAGPGRCARYPGAT
jgi:hypothetical protein